MVLAFCKTSNRHNICIKLHEDILKQFLSYRAGIKSQNLLFSVSKGHDSKTSQSSITDLAFCMSTNVS